MDYRWPTINAERETTQSKLNAQTQRGLKKKKKKLRRRVPKSRCVCTSQVYASLSRHPSHIHAPPPPRFRERHNYLQEPAQDDLAFLPASSLELDRAIVSPCQQGTNVTTEMTSFSTGGRGGVSKLSRVYTWLRSAAATYTVVLQKHIHIYIRRYYNTFLGSQGRDNLYILGGRLPYHRL